MEKMIPGQTNKKYSYLLRPGYGSEALLIEFVKGPIDAAFWLALSASLSEINFQLGAVKEIWMNDEHHINATSDAGTFLITKDIWDFVFILADDNQGGLRRVDQILAESADFQKDEADFEKYRKQK